MIRPSGRVFPAAGDEPAFGNAALPLPEAKEPEVINLDDFRVNNATMAVPDATEYYAGNFRFSFEPQHAAREVFINRYKQAQDKTSLPGSDSNFEIRF